MEIFRQMYLTSAPASATAGTIVLSPQPGMDSMGEIQILQVQLIVAAMEAGSCNKFIGNHLASCPRYLVTVDKLQ